MKPTVLILLFILALSSCDPCSCDPPPKPKSFEVIYKEAHKLDYFDYIIFAQGVVLESHQDYGKKIEVIVDLKGNFPEKTTTFIAFESYENEYLRMSNLSIYNNQDTLLMFLRPVWDWEEKRGDYTTLYNAHSVLQLSNGSVSGYITSYKKKSTMQWKDFQALLNLTKEAQL